MITLRDCKLSICLQRCVRLIADVQYLITSLFVASRLLFSMPL